MRREYTIRRTDRQTDGKTRSAQVSLRRAVDRQSTVVSCTSPLWDRTANNLSKTALSSLRLVTHRSRTRSVADGEESIMNGEGFERVSETLQRQGRALTATNRTISVTSSPHQSQGRQLCKLQARPRRCTRVVNLWLSLSSRTHIRCSSERPFIRL